MTDKKPLDHAVELAVFAPIGFALEARRLLPSFVERGRAQVTMAKVVGQFAVTTGQAEAAKRVARVQEQAEALLTEFGLGGGPATPGSGPVAEPAPASDPAPTPATAPAAASAPVRSSGGSASLPIADYDSLAASQVIPRLAGLSPEELDAVEAYEQAHRGRKTILGKVSQLREA
ncbi:MAG: hypothetical protein KDB04_02160 [Acidimicrobiales bacterium]|nr:hypothetical protein [Acidimicrobiales bacterium]HRW38324.1 hypothetical protein [Aquihabitans sp.]